MQDIKQQIISVLKEKGTEVSTSEIMESVSAEYRRLKSEKKYNEARQLHRKILYYINALVRERLIRLEKYGRQGQKYFIINVTEGEDLSYISPTLFKKRLIGKDLVLPATPIEGYERDGIVRKFEPDTWSDRLNAVVIMCEKVKSKPDLFALIERLFPVTNDCVCLENFEIMLNKGNIMAQLKKLDRDCDNYDKRISCMIHLSELDREKFKKILEDIPKLKNIEFIYCASDSDNEKFLGDLTSAYAKNKETLYIKNSNRCKAPWFVGKAGLYSFKEKEWLNLEKANCVACSQSSVIVDATKFYEKYGVNANKLTDLLMNISKSFLKYNPVQRKKLSMYFKYNVHDSDIYGKDWLEAERNYIRFWNFGLLEPGIDQNKVLDLLDKARKKVDDFCEAEEVMFNSCGMSIRFRVALSVASRRSKNDLSPAKYKKIEFENLEDLKSSAMNDKMSDIRNISCLLNGGNPINFMRKGLYPKSQDMAQEISFILNNYKLRFFAVDFENGN